QQPIHPAVERDHGAVRRPGQMLQGIFRMAEPAEPASVGTYSVRLFIVHDEGKPLSVGRPGELRDRLPTDEHAAASTVETHTVDAEAVVGDRLAVRRDCEEVI